MGMMDALIDFLTGKTAERLQRLETHVSLRERLDLPSEGR